jgi:imidazolonepropionase-like amidohydrolase
VPKFLDRPAKEIETGEFKIVRDFSASAKACFDLVDNLPDQSELSDIEIRAVLVEVISGKLEWAYHQSDGDYKMAAYAHAALEQAGLPTFLSEAEKRELRGSRIYPFLKRQL